MEISRPQLLQRQRKEEPKAYIIFSGDPYHVVSDPWSRNGKLLRLGDGGKAVEPRSQKVVQTYRTPGAAPSLSLNSRDGEWAER